MDEKPAISARDEDRFSQLQPAGFSASETARVDGRAPGRLTGPSGLPASGYGVFCPHCSGLLHIQTAAEAVQTSFRTIQTSFREVQTCFRPIQTSFRVLQTAFRVIQSSLLAGCFYGMLLHLRTFSPEKALAKVVEARFSPRPFQAQIKSRCWSSGSGRQVSSR